MAHSFHQNLKFTRPLHSCICIGIVTIKKGDITTSIYRSCNSTYIKAVWNSSGHLVLATGKSTVLINLVSSNILQLLNSCLFFILPLKIIVLVKLWVNLYSYIIVILLKHDIIPVYAHYLLRRIWHSAWIMFH